ncbi:MAG: M6 family metalloprotease domain-containing protein [Elusimicrobiales bacterium]|nr:M6 family metalloprotease domain-containing protein [Elusimicrobiales bacterium]
MNLTPVQNKAAKLLLGAALGLFLALGAAALEAPAPGYAITRSASRGASALGIGSQSADPALVSNFYRAVLPGKGVRAAAAGRGLPAKGSPKMLVLLVDFDDYPARAGDTPAHMSDLIFGAGGDFPYESLTAYYRRSSGGQLEVRGEVLGWYRAGLRSEIPQTREGRDAVIKRALLAYPDHDLTQYDSDGDGVIDYLAVIWTGPTGEWATFWWGCATWFSDPSFTAGGVRPGRYSWQAVLSNHQAPGEEYSVRTLLHETGHALGLPDYYDYAPGVGPDGGLGYFDMMDANRYDHNCFSKILLGWVQPRVVAEAGEFGLQAAGEGGDCVVVIPAGKSGQRPDEVFIVERRSGTGNDARLGSGGGFVVWHVDITPGEGGARFRYNNQTTEHKLIKFMEADGLEELESGKSKAVTQADFFAAGGSFGAGSGPSSALYGGEAGGVEMYFSAGAPLDLVALKYPAQPVLAAAR